MNVLGVQLSSGTGWTEFRPNRKWEIQDGGLSTSYICVSTLRQDIKWISTAILEFYAIHIQLWDFCTTKPELVIPRWLLPNRKCTQSQVVDMTHMRHDSKTISTARHMFSEMGKSTKLTKIAYLLSGCIKSNMAVIKPEIHLYQLIEKI